jgi:septum formation protein
MSARLILASTSPTRAALMRAAGLTFETVRPEVDEDGARAAWIASGKPLAALAAHLAIAKARDVAARYPSPAGSRLVIGADQVLVVDRQILSKPGDRDGVVQTLRLLRGRTHTLTSAVAVLDGGLNSYVDARSADLTMRDLTDGEIDRYVEQAGADVTGCVGGYQIEALGMTLFEAIEGDHSTILGLPMLPLLATLRRLTSTQHPRPE